MISSVTTPRSCRSLLRWKKQAQNTRNTGRCLCLRSPIAVSDVLCCQSALVQQCVSTTSYTAMDGISPNFGRWCGPVESTDETIGFWRSLVKDKVTVRSNIRMSYCCGRRHKHAWRLCVYHIYSQNYWTDIHGATLPCQTLMLASVQHWRSQKISQEWAKPLHIITFLAPKFCCRFVLLCSQFLALVSV